MFHVSTESANPDLHAAGRVDGADAASAELRKIDPSPEPLTEAHERSTRICAAYWAY